MGRTEAAIAAAVDVARAHGLAEIEPELLQETNNVVVWLRPHDVVAKVATRPDARADIGLEHAVAGQLVAAGAEIAMPLDGASPAVHAATGFVVTLWEHVPGVDRAATPSAVLAASLQRLHAALATTTVELPSFRTAVARARTALDDDGFMAAMAPDDLGFLRSTYDQELARLDEQHPTMDERRLHGEPHDGNRMITPAGIRWIDFESCCLGPLEWDAAFLPDDVVEHLPGVDRGLLTRLRRLNSARVATWCWATAHHPVMRTHGELHLALLRAT